MTDSEFRTGEIEHPTRWRKASRPFGHLPIWLKLPVLSEAQRAALKLAIPQVVSKRTLNLGVLSLVWLLLIGFVPIHQRGNLEGL